LQEPTFLILSGLAGESLHGYAIIATVTELVRRTTPAEADTRRQAGQPTSPSSSMETSRISTLRTLPVTVIGNASTTLT
jgi:hypothetical protein